MSEEKKTTKIVLQTEEPSSIEPAKSAQIKASFDPMVKMLEEFEGKYNEVIEASADGITPEVAARAKRLHIDIGKVATATEKVRKAQKQEYLLAGRAIDGASNILKWAISDKRNKLKEIVEHEKAKAEEARQALQAERVTILSEFVDDAEERDLARLQPDEFEALLSMKKQQHLDRIEAERKAEADRIAKEKAEEEERLRVVAENKRLAKEKKEAEEKLEAERKEREAEEAKRLEAERKEREAKEQLRQERSAEMQPYIVFIRDYNSLIESTEEDYQSQMSDIKRGAEEQWKFDREQEAKAAAEEEARKKKEQEDRLAREKLEREAKERRDAEAKAAAEAEAKEQAELNKGDAAKRTDLLSDLRGLKEKYQFKSKKNKAMFADVVKSIDTIINTIEQ